MQNRTNIIRLTFFIFLLFAVNERIYAGHQNISAVKAMQLFDAGNFAEAEALFKHLLNEDPQNPMLNYYYGASRTETGHFGDSDLNCLLLAGENVTPDRLNYYKGMQYHARENWEQALKFYNQFRLSVPENEQQEMGIAEKIQQCFDHVNPFENSITKQPEIKQEKIPEAELTVPEVTDIPKPDSTFANNVSVNTGEKNEEETAPDYEVENQTVHKTGESAAENPEEFAVERRALPDLPGVKPTHGLPTGEQINFQVNNQITYLFSSQFKTDDGKKLFEQGRELEQTLDKKLRQADKLREDYKKEPNPEIKATLGEKILAMETDSYNLQDEIKEKFRAARTAEKKFWENAGSVAIYNFQVENEKIESALSGNSPEAEPTPENNSIVLLPMAGSELYEPSPNNATQPADQLVYKIQIGAYSRAVPAYRKRLYNKLSLIRKIDNYTDEQGVVVYTTGNLTNFEDAEKMRNQVKQEGIEDALVVPYFNGKRITLEQAKKIEAGDDI
ncbi:hypothetical protein SAMN05444274_102353 [Mariniphaga anaerophila]|uniref:Tetratricopeptide repeat-containing protein n=1 Tax=Mariniphaga anaerophila TaxID=1484053 RepID=A0A1M4W805_9BACT|nr:SPOR domain-containing protein [Mariniphaga anaerophila]SHE77290.1 hypothetical protein SAMN05444274_102353 [Mariniphaga anaerophila]